MLYDNALLLRSYADAHRVFQGPLFEGTARDIAAYVTREMTDETGGYHASQDADSEGEEGKFFVWNPAGVRAALAKTTWRRTWRSRTSGSPTKGTSRSTGA